MAESQVTYPNLPEQVAAIRISLSEPRFATYLAKGGGDQAYALELYLYNARVAKAFMFPLSVVEVTLRNAIDAFLVVHHGVSWHLDPAFRTSILMPEGLKTLDKAIDRAGADASRDQVIAELTFDFWSNLFRPNYGNLWRPGLNIVLPNIGNATRHDVQSMVKEINRFRNRVAHHEPVLDLNVTATYAKIVELVGLRCSETAAWLKYHSTVSAVTRTRPRGPAAGFTSLGTGLAPDFVKVTGATLLSVVADEFDSKCQVAICIDDHGTPIGAFGTHELIKHISASAKPAGGLVDLSDHTVENLLAITGIDKKWITMPASDPLAIAVEHLVKKKVNIVIGTDAKGGLVGVLMRALRRY